MIEKHMPYFRLMEAFNTQECPICHLLIQNVDRYFQTLIYEGINDRGFRVKFRKNNGFCHSHAHQFADYQDGLGVVLTHRDILADHIDRIQKDIKSRTDHHHCMVCDMINIDEKVYYDEMKNRFDDTDFRKIFFKSNGLCVCHFDRFFSYSKKVPGWIKEFQIEKYKGLLDLSDKYLNWSNITQRKEELSKEQLRVSSDIIAQLFGLKNSRSFTNLN